MATREELVERVLAAKRELAGAEASLKEWEGRAENNVFESMPQAESVIEDALLGLANDDCEGSYNCGAESYSREFIVDGKTYVGTLTVEYSRHDKTYYYVDGHEFSITEKQSAAGAAA